ncbi:MAG: uridine kinase [Arachnia sp.]
MTRTLLLIAGASGSGKSRLTRLAEGRTTALCLDDFYRDADHPGLPMTPMGIPDWDDVATWDLPLALETIGRLLVDGTAEVPVYDISLSRRVGRKVVDARAAQVVVAEGIFAVETLRPALEAGLAAEGWWLDRRRGANFARRLTRDLRERRKTPAVLLRRGAALYRAEPTLRRTALDAGFRPVGMRAALGRLAEG